MKAQHIVLSADQSRHWCSRNPEPALIRGHRQHRVKPSSERVGIKMRDTLGSKIHPRTEPWSTLTSEGKEDKEEPAEKPEK